MAGFDKNEYAELLQRAKEVMQRGEVKTLTALADALGIQRTTLREGFARHFKIHNFEQLERYFTDRKALIGSDNTDKIDVEMDGNFATVRAVNVEGQIKTIDQLLRTTGIDPAEWEVVNPKVKKWDVAIKLKTGDIETINVVPSIYIEAPLRSKNPTAFEPTIQPITIEMGRLPKAGSGKKSGVRRALIVNDAQVGYRRTLHTTSLRPFHDRRVLDLALQIAQEEEIDHISFGGDMLDLSEWSTKFTPEPEFFWTTQPALLELAWWLAQFRAARPTATIRMLEGNHDARLPNLIVNQMRQAYKLRAVDELQLPPSLSIPRLLALHTINVDYVANYPDNGYWLNKNVLIAHGDVVRSGPGDTAKAVVNKSAFTTIFGHIHRREHVSRRLKTHDGDLIYSAFCPGCVCRIDGAVPGSKSDDQWQQGLAIIEYTDESENIIPIAVNNGVMIYQGRVWKARIRDAEAEKMVRAGLESLV
jgi:metallophosphoesterase superfamily enzyme